MTDAGVDWLVPELLHVKVYVRVSGDATTTVSVMAALPLVARVVPAQPSFVPPPLATQVFALAEVQVSVVELPEAIVVGDATRDTERAGQETITVVCADLDCEPAVHDSPYGYVPAVVSVTDCMPLALTVPVQPSAAEPPVITQEVPGDSVHVILMGTPVIVAEALDERVT